MIPNRHMVLADTGPLYAAIDPADQYHQQAQADLALLEEDRMDVGISIPTISESYTLVLYRLGVVVAHRWLSELLSASTLIFTTEDDLYLASRLLQRFDDQLITVHDALIAVVSDRLAIPVWTYDHHFDVMRAQRWRDLQ